MYVWVKNQWPLHPMTQMIIVISPLNISRLFTMSDTNRIASFPSHSPGVYCLLLFYLVSGSLNNSIDEVSVFYHFSTSSPGGRGHPGSWALSNVRCRGGDITSHLTQRRSPHDGGGISIIKMRFLFLLSLPSSLHYRKSDRHYPGPVASKELF